jgi:hypothetical protein
MDERDVATTAAGSEPELVRSSVHANGSRFLLWMPIAAAIAYPWTLIAFHSAVITGNRAVAAIWLIVAFSLPLSCLALASTNRVQLTPGARRLAYAGVTAPPLYVFVGVASGLLKSPFPERVTWVVGWVFAGMIASIVKTGYAPPVATTSRNRLQFAHGVSATLILLFVAFHLFNHLTGLIGPEMHAHIMAFGRRVYRSRMVEPMLIALLFFQVVSGVRLAWRWSRTAVDLPRAIQVGSGVYLSAFIITHLNSALISARTVHHIETNWAWASGGESGLIMDAWNIRLVPHYALGVFFIVTHVVCGLRIVLLAHGIREQAANRILWGGMGFAAVLSTAIISGLCGVRI